MNPADTFRTYLALVTATLGDVEPGMKQLITELLDELRDVDQGHLISAQLAVTFGLLDHIAGDTGTDAATLWRGFTELASGLPTGGSDQ
ncbi:hypothetical protein [Streptomyces zhihengii]